MMKRVGRLLAPGAALAVLLLAGGSLSESVESPLHRALHQVRRQDYRPLFDIAGGRVCAVFRPERENAFVEELMSLSGKWKALTRGQASYEKLVRKLFERHVFGPADLEGLYARLREDLAYGFAAMENRLLVSIEADLRVARPELSVPELRQEYRRLAAELAGQAAGDLGMNLVSFAGSEAVSILGLSALASSGVLGPALAAGGASGAWSLGAGLILGIGAGLAIDWALGDAYEASARAEVRRVTQAIRTRLIDAVHDTLAEAVVRHRALQEARVSALFERRPHGGVARHP